jgi:hypothetical protein
MPNVDKLKEALDTEMLLASRALVISEQLDGKSVEYARGFMTGLELQTDFMSAFLSPKLTELNANLDRLLERGIEI